MARDDGVVYAPGSDVPDYDWQQKARLLEGFDFAIAAYITALIALFPGVFAGLATQSLIAGLVVGALSWFGSFVGMVEHFANGELRSGYRLSETRNTWNELYGGKL